MRHFADLNKEDRDKLVEEFGIDLGKFFDNAQKKFDMCSTCLHNMVIGMCENYLIDLLEEADNERTRH